ncbi:MAG: hypothetical protein HQM11_07570 [SAR324 cluster bacterium]|nr:hypothetical protein [SAR324 cluster bacterium]
MSKTENSTREVEDIEVLQRHFLRMQYLIIKEFLKQLPPEKHESFHDFWARQEAQHFRECCDYCLELKTE